MDIVSLQHEEMMSAIYIITENKNYEKSFFEEKHFNSEAHEKCLRLSI